MKRLMVGAAFALAISAAARGEDEGVGGNEAGPGKPEWGEEAGGLRARLEVVTHEHCFVVTFRLRNVTDEERRVETGRGGQGLTNVPRLMVRAAVRGSVFLRVTPATWLGPSRRSMGPDYVRIPAGKEVVYGRFTLGYERLICFPKSKFVIAGRLSLDRGLPAVAAPEVRFTMPPAAVADWARDRARLGDPGFTPLAWRILIERKVLKPGMTREELLDILGGPTGRRERDGREHLYWYRDSPRHVNPGVRAVVEDGKVTSVEEYRA